MTSLDSGSSRHHCPLHGDVSCPICGSPLVLLEYKGNDPDLLALMKQANFYALFGCNHLELHDKVVNGVDHRGKVFIKGAVVRRSDIRKRKKAL